MLEMKSVQDKLQEGCLTQELCVRKDLSCWKQLTVVVGDIITKCYTNKEFYISIKSEADQACVVLFRCMQPKN